MHSSVNFLTGNYQNQVTGLGIHQIRATSWVKTPPNACGAGEGTVEGGEGDYLRVDVTHHEWDKFRDLLFWA